MIRSKPALKIAAIVFAVIILIAIVFAYWNVRDRHRGYTLDLNIQSAGDAPLMAGFAAVTITTEIPDRWHDSDNNSRYEPNEGNTYDDMWARTMVIDDGQTRIAVVSVDLVGLFHSEVVDIRKMLSEDTGIRLAR